MSLRRWALPSRSHQTHIRTARDRRTDQAECRCIGKARTLRGLCGNEPKPPRAATLVSTAHRRRPVRPGQWNRLGTYGIRSRRVRQGWSPCLSGFYPPSKHSLVRTLRIQTGPDNRNRRASSGLSNAAPRALIFRVVVTHERREWPPGAVRPAPPNGCFTRSQRASPWSGECPGVANAVEKVGPYYSSRAFSLPMARTAR